jgi:hypothetical protein
MKTYIYKLMPMDWVCEEILKYILNFEHRTFYQSLDCGRPENNYYHKKINSIKNGTTFQACKGSNKLSDFQTRNRIVN